MDPETNDVIIVGRRRFIRNAMAGIAGFTAAVFWSRDDRLSAGTPGHAEVQELPGAFVAIRPDNSVLIRCNRPDMGQGTMTSMPLLVAEDLEVDWPQVVVEWAPTRPPFTDPGFYGVEWSSAVRDMYKPLRELGAGLKQLLVEAAARRWSVSPQLCLARAGYVYLPQSSLVASYASLAPEIVTQALPAKPVLKDAAAFRLLGKRTPNRLTTDVVQGTLIYGLDQARSGALTAMVARPPNTGATLAHADRTAARAVGGVISVEDIAQGVAVVARDFWSAHRGIEALAATWDARENARWDTGSIRAHLREAVAGPATFVPVDYFPVQSSGNVAEVIYEVPYQAHAALEPTSALADAGAGGCSVQMATQNVSHVVEEVSKALGIEVHRVVVEPAYMGGSFGRKYDAAPAVEAALLSQRLGRPVKLVWSRGDEMTCAPHRPAQTGRFTAALGESGLPEAIDVHYAGPSYFLRTSADVERIRSRRGGFDGSTFEGIIPFPYPVPHLRVAQSWVDFGIRVGPWRSTSHSFGTFFVESLVDELAQRAGEDPFDFRLRWWRDGRPFPAEYLPASAFNPAFQIDRMTAVIARLRDRSGWDSRKRRGVHLGAAVQFSYEGYFGAVAQVVTTPPQSRVTRAWIVADIGQLVNRSAAEQQLVGGFIFGLTAATKTALTIARGVVEQTNFDSFPVLRLDEVPAIDVEFVHSSASPGGLGEAGVPLAAPAVANALFASTGDRQRRLPIRLAAAG